MKPHERLTQKDLKFGIYWGRNGKQNSGLHVWIFGRYVWPLEKKVVPPEKVKAARKPRAKKADPQMTLADDPRLQDGIEISSHVAGEGQAAQTVS